MKFGDLEFKPQDRGLDGVQAHAFFPNGYGASIIRSAFSYGGTRGLYELAVLKGTPDQNMPCYDTPVTSDVLGYLSEDDVTAALNKIEALRPWRAA